MAHQHLSHHTHARESDSTFESDSESDSDSSPVSKGIVVGDLTKGVVVSRFVGERMKLLLASSDGDTVDTTFKSSHKSA